MSKTTVIMITSCKGGVGKSTVAANLGVSLALQGKPTLVIDCDFGVRSLDLIMGMENDIIYDIGDIILRDIPVKKAIIQSKKISDLYFCAAPYTYDNDISVDLFHDKVMPIVGSGEYEYIIIDTPGEMGDPVKFAASVSHIALIVSTNQPASLRAAERTGLMLRDLGIEKRRLVVNCFTEDDYTGDEGPGLIEIIDKTSLQLLGIIPYEQSLAKAQAKGESVFDCSRNNARVSIENITGRLFENNIPLFTGFSGIKRKKLLKKIQ